MTIKNLGAMFLIAFSAFTCSVQSSEAQSITNWGEPTCDTELSIDLSNNVTAVDSTNSLQCRIKNSTTNLIYVVEVNPMTDFAIFLTDSSGGVHKITPDAKSAIFHRIVRELNAGQIYECSVPVKIGKNIQPGDYFLKTTRHILTADNKSCELVSNILKLRVIK